MDKLDQASEDQVILMDIPAEPSAKDEKEGPDSLAAAIENVVGNLINEGNFGVKIAPDLGLNFLKVLTIDVPHLFHRQRILHDWWSFSHGAR